MKKPNNIIIQNNFSIDGQTFENFMVLTFMENNRVSSSYVLRFPEWHNFYDADYKYYIPNLN